MARRGRKAEKEARGAVGHRLAALADQKWGPGEWTQALIAKATGVPESTVSRHFRLKSLPLEASLTYRDFFRCRIDYLEPAWKEVVRRIT